MAKVLNDTKFGIAKNIVFDKAEKFIAIVSEREVAILSLNSHEEIQYKTICEQYSSIEDIIINSTPTDDKINNLSIIVACK